MIPLQNAIDFSKNYKLLIFVRFNLSYPNTNSEYGYRYNMNVEYGYQVHKQILDMI